MNLVSEELKIEQFIRAPRARVFAAWLDPADVRRWFEPPEMRVTVAEIDPVVGGAYTIRIDKDAETSYTVKGVYEAIEPHDRLVFSWAWQRPEAYDSRVVVEFFERDGGTLLVLRHQRLNADDAADHRDGWGMCLGQLNALLQ